MRPYKTVGYGSLRKTLKPSPTPYCNYFWWLLIMVANISFFMNPLKEPQNLIPLNKGPTLAVGLGL